MAEKIEHSHESTGDALLGPFLCFPTDRLKVQESQKTPEQDWGLDGRIFRKQFQQVVNFLQL